MEHQDTSQDPYQPILDRIERIIEGKGFQLNVDYTNEDDGSITFKILTAGDKLASHITTHITTGDVVKGTTRKRKERVEDVPTFGITWLGTEPDYRGQGFAMLLLIYAICYLKRRYAHVEYVLLDDDSDRSARLDVPNIYNAIGFEFQDFYSDLSIDIDSPRHMKIPGPEKQLLLNQQFVRRVNRILDNFETRGGLANNTRRKSRIRIFKKSRKSKNIANKKYNKSQRRTKTSKSNKSLRRHIVKK